MNLREIIINGTDTLGRGVEASPGSYRNTGYRVAVEVIERDVIGADFREFDRHLTRLLGQGQWAYEPLYSGKRDRRYYFRSQFTIDLEPVPFVSAEAPKDVAALVGDDPYTTPGDINFLLEGDRFRAEKNLPGGRKKVAYGTAAMDGHAISPTHGWLIAEAEGNASVAAAKRKAYEDTEKSYINVHWDYREPGDYDASVAYSPRRGSTPEVLYKPSGEFWPNEGLYPVRDGWKIYVLPSVAKRKTQTLAEARKRTQLNDAENRLAKAQQALREAENAVRNATQHLNGLQ